MVSNIHFWQKLISWTKPTDAEKITLSVSGECCICSKARTLMPKILQVIYRLLTLSLHRMTVSLCTKYILTAITANSVNKISSMKFLTMLYLLWFLLVLYRVNTVIVDKSCKIIANSYILLHAQHALMGCTKVIIVFAACCEKSSLKVGSTMEILLCTSIDTHN